MIYEYPQDGRLHTRYSELSRCTLPSSRGSGQLIRVVKERFGEIQPFSSDHTGLGSTRHEMYSDEIGETHKIPQCFSAKCPEYTGVNIDMSEQELKAEIFDQVVLHSTPDAVSSESGIIFDFKVTTAKAEKYKASKQLLVYAYQMLLRGITVSEIVFLIENWNSEKTAILGYDYYSQKITFEDVVGVKPWIKERCEVLLAGMEAYKKGELV